MTFVRPILWTSFGVILGVSLVLVGGQLRAQQITTDGDQRLFLTPAFTSAAPITINTASGRVRHMAPRLQAFFVRDTKSDGCWLATLGSEGQFASVAVAPTAACQ